MSSVGKRKRKRCYNKYVTKILGTKDCEYVVKEMETFLINVLRKACIVCRFVEKKIVNEEHIICSLKIMCKKWKEYSKTAKEIVEKYYEEKIEESNRQQHCGLDIPPSITRKIMKETLKKEGLKAVKRLYVFCSVIMERMLKEGEFIGECWEEFLSRKVFERGVRDEIAIICCENSTNKMYKITKGAFCLLKENVERRIKEILLEGKKNLENCGRVRMLERDVTNE